MQVKIYTDGAARGNPDGPGGYGAVLQYIDTKGQLHERELSRGYKKTTNNRMELMAAIVALEALNRPCQVELYSDSKYLVDAFNQHWIVRPCQGLPVHRKRWWIQQKPQSPDR